MDPLREQLARRREANTKALAALGGAPVQASPAGHMRTIREGAHATVFTVGYERRTPEDLIATLRDAGVEVLADVREKPISRRACFRAEALRALCEEAGIVYQSWPRLGSTDAQRESLRRSGDIAAFQERFRAYAEAHLLSEIRKLADEVRRKPVALLCYERSHEDCHRMIIAELIADTAEAGIVAIL